MMKNRPTNGKNNRTQSGMGIVEVLVALVVVSFGVLGMASLQLTGMKHSSGGFNRSQALLYAQNMATHIRLNQDAVNDETSLEYAGFDSTGFNCDLKPAPYCQATPDSAAEDCTFSELADFDKYTVACGDVGSGGADKGVIGTLPNGTLTITCLGASCTTDSAYQITVSWTEGRSRSDTNELVTRRVQVRLRP